MSQKFFKCLIRQSSVVSTPEEKVRQSLLKYMVDQLGYPLETLVVEKGLHQMPHLNFDPSQIPNRRSDIVCFAKGIHPDHSLYPLLLIECKSVKLNVKVKNQVIGYNRYVRSFYIAIANEEEIQTGWFNPAIKSYQFVNGLPQYRDLRACLSRPD